MTAVATAKADVTAAVAVGAAKAVDRAATPVVVKRARKAGAKDAMVNAADAAVVAATANAAHNANA